MAILSSKVFALEIERYSQSAFAITQGKKEHEDQSIMNASKYIENNYPALISNDLLDSLPVQGRRS